MERPHLSPRPVCWHRLVHCPCSTALCCWERRAYLLVIVCCSGGGGRVPCFLFHIFLSRSLVLPNFCSHSAPAPRLPQPVAQSRRPPRAAHSRHVHANFCGRPLPPAEPSHYPPTRPPVWLYRLPGTSHSMEEGGHTRRNPITLAPHAEGAVWWRGGEDGNLEILPAANVVAEDSAY